jgi:chemotaxis protein MotB
LGLLAAAGLLLAAGCGGPSRAERAMAEKDSQIRRYEEEKAQAAERERILQEQQALALKQNQLQAEQLGEMGRRTAQLAASADAKMDALRAQVAELEGKIGAQKGSQVEVVRGDQIGSITIRVANTVLFDVGKADLKSSAYATLDKVADTLKKQYADHFVRVEGHTDSTPVIVNKSRYADNMVLSQARSKAVFDYLIQHGKMPANRMYTAGYACSQPVVWPEKTVEDRSKNRRVDIVILPNIKVEKESLTAGR